jgi:HEAT repeat protein
VHVGSELSVRFWGLVRYCPYVKEEEEAQLLFDTLGKGPSMERTWAAHELVSIGDMAIAGLAGMIDNEKREVRQQALDCLAALCARQAVPDILRFLDSSKWGLAKSAAYTLGWLGDPRAVEPLVKVVNESNNDALVAEAAGALGAIGDERAVSALKGLLSDASPKRSLAAAQGLALMGIRDGLSLALKALEGEDKVAISDSLSALWIIGGKEAHEALLDFGHKHEKESIGKEAWLFATLVGARDSAVDQRRQILQNLLAQKGIERLLAAYEIERLQAQEALRIYGTEIEHFESHGDFESSGNLRSLLLRCMARKAWEEGNL